MTPAETRDATLIGSRVKIADHSEAHGDLGIIDCIQENGIILVLLDTGCIWPITSKSDLEFCDLHERKPEGGE